MLQCSVFLQRIPTGRLSTRSNIVRRQTPFCRKMLPPPVSSGVPGGGGAGAPGGPAPTGGPPPDAGPVDAGEGPRDSGGSSGVPGGEDEDAGTPGGEEACTQERAKADRTCSPKNKDGKPIGDPIYSKDFNCNAKPTHECNECAIAKASAEYQCLNQEGEWEFQGCEPCDGGVSVCHCRQVD